MPTMGPDSSRPIHQSLRAKQMHNRKGFTFIELLIVVVIIGILAGIAIPKYANTKQKAYLAKMRGDLRNIAAAQEAFSAEAVGYYSGTVPASVLMYSPTPGVSITLSNVTLTGWAAVASYPGGTTRICALFYGSGGPVA